MMGVSSASLLLTLFRSFAVGSERLFGGFFVCFVVFKNCGCSSKFLFGATLPFGFRSYRCLFSRRPRPCATVMAELTCAIDAQSANGLVRLCIISVNSDIFPINSALMLSTSKVFVDMPCTDQFLLWFGKIQNPSIVNIVGII